MKASAYIQITPNRRSNGTLKDLSISKVTQGYPRSPEPGALVIELAVDIDPAVFEPVIVDLEVTGDLETLGASIIPVPVPVQDNDDAEE